MHDTSGFKIGFIADVFACADRIDGDAGALLNLDGLLQRRVARVILAIAKDDEHIGDAVRVGMPRGRRTTSGLQDRGVSIPQSYGMRA